MRLQPREGGIVHHGHRVKAKGGYEVSCRRRKLVPFSGWKRTKKPVNCPGCVEEMARQKMKRERELVELARRQG